MARDDRRLRAASDLVDAHGHVSEQIDGAIDDCKLIMQRWVPESAIVGLEVQLIDHPDRRADNDAAPDRLL